MPYRKISNDLKEATIRLLARGQDSLEDILDIVGMSESTYRRALRRIRETGSVACPQPISKGRPRRLLREDEDYVLALMKHNPTLYLDEYADLLNQHRAITVSNASICRLFAHHGVTLKRSKKIASERNALARADFIRRISRHPIHTVLCIDETSKDERTYFRANARSLRGQDAEVAAPFVRGRRYTLLPALDITGMVAYKVCEGSFDRELFIAFLRDHVVCNFNYLHILLSLTQV